jgi:hypothetical protein
LTDEITVTLQLPLLRDGYIYDGAKYQVIAVFDMSSLKWVLFFKHPESDKYTHYLNALVENKVTVEFPGTIYEPDIIFDETSFICKTYSYDGGHGWQYFKIIKHLLEKFKVVSRGRFKSNSLEYIDNKLTSETLNKNLIKELATPFDPDGTVWFYYENNLYMCCDVGGIVREMDLYLPIPEVTKEFNFNMDCDYNVKEEVSPFTWTFSFIEEKK